MTKNDEPMTLRDAMKADDSSAVRAQVEQLFADYPEIVLDVVRPEIEKMIGKALTSATGATGQ